MRRRRVPALETVAMALTLSACGGDDATEPTPPKAPPPEHDAGGCAPGETARDDGGCEPAGVPVDRCGDGFETDGARGCRAVLPAEACPFGKMAIPGETACHEVAPCAPGRFGDIPVEADTQYVDAKYAGNESDGSAERPWRFVQEGADAADAGAIVAIAAGTYVEDVVLDKPVRIWGVCPALVEIAGVALDFPLQFDAASPGAEVRDLALTGPAFGFGASGSSVLLDRVWIHDAPRGGLDAEDVFGPTAIAITRSLIERVGSVGAHVFGSSLEVDATVLRDVEPGATASNGGRGIELVSDSESGSRATLHLTNTLLERTHEAGVVALSSDVTIERAVIRDTRARARAGPGVGVVTQQDPKTSSRSNLVVKNVVVERNDTTGFQLNGADADLSWVTIRESRGDTYGRGIEVGPGVVLVVRASTITDNLEFGIFASACSIELDAVLSRNAQGIVDERTGHGLVLVDEGGIRATAAVRGSVFENNAAVGVMCAGSDLLLETSRVSGTRAAPNMLGGRGVEAQPNPDSGATCKATVRASLIDGNRDVGLLVASASAIVEDTVVKSTAARADKTFGDGIAVVSELGPADVTVTGCVVDHSARAGLDSFGALMRVKSTTVTCTPIPVNGETFKDLPFSFDNLGDNACGCGDVLEKCIARSSNLVPPTAGSF